MRALWLLSLAREKVTPPAGAHPGRTREKSRRGVPRRGKGKGRRGSYPSSSIFKTAMKASVGICTVPKLRIFFFPSFCFSSSFFFRVMSPP